MSLPLERSERAAAAGSGDGHRLAGLRVDVCTYQGCREGLGGILDVLGARGVRASIFVAMGPDRSGRAVLRIFRKKGFLRKMFRTGATSMYGIRTALYGTLLPSPVISRRCASVLRRAVAEGHEVGIHSWDHVTWQDHLDALSTEDVRLDYVRAIEAYAEVVGVRPTCSGSPAWLASDTSLEVAETLGLRFASDCRGRGPYVPSAGGRALSLPQVPVTLPTLDELLGTDGMTAEGYNRYILDSLRPGALQVHTAHAEAEGRLYRPYFEKLLDEARRLGWSLVPLGDLLAAAPAPLPVCPVERGLVDGRAGAVSIQGRPLEVNAAS